MRVIWQGRWAGSKAARLGCLTNHSKRNLVCACCISACDKGDTILCFLSISPHIRRCSFGAAYVALGINLKYKPVSSQLYTSSGSFSSRIFLISRILSLISSGFISSASPCRRTLFPMLFLYISFCHQPFDALKSCSLWGVATCSILKETGLDLCLLGRREINATTFSSIALYLISR